MFVKVCIAIELHQVFSLLLFQRALSTAAALVAPIALNSSNPGYMQVVVSQPSRNAARFFCCVTFGRFRVVFRALRGTAFVVFLALVVFFRLVVLVFRLVVRMIGGGGGGGMETGGAGGGSSGAIPARQVKP